jgi:hypothetical protein
VSVSCLVCLISAKFTFPVTPVQKQLPCRMLAERDMNIPVTPVQNKAVSKHLLSNNFLTPVQKNLPAPSPLGKDCITPNQTVAGNNAITPIQAVASFMAHLNENFPKAGPVFNKSVAMVLSESAQPTISPISLLRNKVSDILSKKNLSRKEKRKELMDYQNRMEASFQSNLSLLGEVMVGDGMVTWEGSQGTVIGKRKRGDGGEDEMEEENAAKRMAAERG